MEDNIIMKKIICLLLSCVLVCSMLVGCGGSGSATGKKKTTYKVYDIDSNGYVVFDASKGTAKVVDLWEEIPEIATKINLSSKSAVKYSGTYKVGNTVSFTYACKFDGTKISVTMKIPKTGEKAKINYTY